MDDEDPILRRFREVESAARAPGALVSGERVERSILFRVGSQCAAGVGAGCIVSGLGWSVLFGFGAWHFQRTPLGWGLLVTTLLILATMASTAVRAHRRHIHFELDTVGQRLRVYPEPGAAANTPLRDVPLDSIDHFLARKWTDASRGLSAIYAVQRMGDLVPLTSNLGADTWSLEHQTRVLGRICARPAWLRDGDGTPIPLLEPEA